MAIYSGFSHSKWWFSIVMLVYQRVMAKTDLQRHKTHMFPRFQDELLVEIFWWGRPQASHFPIHKKPWVSGGFVWVSIWAVDGINYSRWHSHWGTQFAGISQQDMCYMVLLPILGEDFPISACPCYMPWPCQPAGGARAEVNRCGLPRTWWPTWAPRMPCARSPTWASAWSTPLLTTARRSSRPALRRPWHSNLGSSNKTEAHQVKESGSSNSRARTIVTWRV